MPGGDGTGPRGRATGRGLGPCGRGSRPLNNNSMYSRVSDKGGGRRESPDYAPLLNLLVTLGARFLTGLIERGIAENRKRRDGSKY